MREATSMLLVLVMRETVETLQVRLIMFERDGR